MQSPSHTRVFCEDIKIPAFASHLPTVCDLLPIYYHEQTGIDSIFDSFTRHAELPGSPAGRRILGTARPRPPRPPRAHLGEHWDARGGTRGFILPGVRALPHPLHPCGQEGCAGCPSGSGCCSNPGVGNKPICTHGTARRRNAKNTIYCVCRVSLAGRNRA